MSPQCSSTMDLAIFKPSPVPARRRLSLESAWLNFPNIFSWNSSGMPGQRSVTPIRVAPGTRCRTASRRHPATATTILVERRSGGVSARTRCRLTAWAWRPGGTSATENCIFSPSSPVPIAIFTWAPSSDRTRDRANSRNNNYLPAGASMARELQTT